MQQRNESMELTLKNMTYIKFYNPKMSMKHWFSFLWIWLSMFPCEIHAQERMEGVYEGCRNGSKTWTPRKYIFFTDGRVKYIELDRATNKLYYEKEGTYERQGDKLNIKLEKILYVDTFIMGRKNKLYFRGGEFLQIGLELKIYYKNGYDVVKTNHKGRARLRLLQQPRYLIYDGERIDFPENEKGVLIVWGKFLNDGVLIEHDETFNINAEGNFFVEYQVDFSDLPMRIEFCSGGNLLD